MDSRQLAWAQEAAESGQIDVSLTNLQTLETQFAGTAPVRELHWMR